MSEIKTLIEDDDWVQISVYRYECEKCGHVIDLDEYPSEIGLITCECGQKYVTEE